MADSKRLEALHGLRDLLAASMGVDEFLRIMKYIGCDAVYLGGGFVEVRDAMQEAASFVIARPSLWDGFEERWKVMRERRASEIVAIMRSVRSAYT